MSVAAFLAPSEWLMDNAGPKYLQLRRRIENGIHGGELPPDAPLLPEREIAALTGLSRVTVRNAIQALVKDGLITRRQGSGSFVTPKSRRMKQSLTRLTSFTEDMERRGFQSESRWLERGIFLASPEEVAALSLGKEENVARIARLRLASGKPMAIERASLSLDVLPRPTDVTTSLYEVLDRDGNRPVRATQKFSAINLDEADAHLLGVEVGMAGLRIERISYLADERIIEFTRSVYRGDSYDFIAELRLDDS